jgi:hypothetical protein
MSIERALVIFILVILVLVVLSWAF